jgi:DNA-binding transcriptional LysR family regulator
MEMHQVRYFLAVSRSLNFTRAAEACNVTQPSLTRAIQLLEAEFGGDLFRRERNLTHLTDLGKRMLPALQRCYDAAAEAKSAAQRFVRSGGLEISVATCAGGDMLAKYLKQVTRAFPGVEINLHRGSPGEALETLKRGDADLVIAETFDDCWERLESYALARERFSLAVNAAHAFAEREEVAAAALTGERLLYLPGTSKIRTLAANANFTGREVALLDDITMLVEAGAGIALLPERAALSAGLVRVEVNGADMESVISLHLAAGRRRSPAVQALVKAVQPKGRGATFESTRDVEARVC